jgi:hypothetical protein
MSQPIARGSQIPIAPARRTAVPMPARGFLPRGLSDACPPGVPHCQVTHRHLITLNDCGPSPGRAEPTEPAIIRRRYLIVSIDNLWWPMSITV